MANSTAFPTVRIGLALSGGGARAIAFHLGCLRGLKQLGLLDKVVAMSSASGGSVIAAMYAYTDEPFAEFERRVITLLESGLFWKIVREYTLSRRIFLGPIFAVIFALGELLMACCRAFVGAAMQCCEADPALRKSMLRSLRWPFARPYTLSSAFEAVLKAAVLGKSTLGEVKKTGLATVINATELQTGTAFRFGSHGARSWRFGTVVSGRDIPVAMAVAASAAYPVFLPPLDIRLRFEDSTEQTDRVYLSDGGLYDNLAVSIFMPGREQKFSLVLEGITHLIACDAGWGISKTESVSSFFPGRLWRSIMASMTRAENLTRSLILSKSALTNLPALVPYLGQMDGKISGREPGFIEREAVVDYPTNFNAMVAENVRLLTLRGEQLVRSLFSEHWASRPEFK